MAWYSFPEHITVIHDFHIIRVTIVTWCILEMGHLGRDLYTRICIDSTQKLTVQKPGRNTSDFHQDKLYKGTSIVKTVAIQ